MFGLRFDRHSWGTGSDSPSLSVPRRQHDPSLCRTMLRKSTQAKWRNQMGWERRSPARDAIRSQVSDALEAQEIKERKIAHQRARMEGWRQRRPAQAMQGLNEHRS